jgi:signal transduction histidine kinase
MRHVDNLTAIVNSLLDVSRIMSHQLELSRQKVDLKKVLEDWLNRYRETIIRSGSQITLQAAHPVIGVWGPLAMETVVSNLLSNALKFGQRKPINIAVVRRRDVALLTVCDHGIGIPFDDQRRIFERFERAVSVKHYGGFGIGLWAARQITEAQGGNIRVSSRPGEGSTFTVELPIDGEIPRTSTASCGRTEALKSRQISG